MPRKPAKTPEKTGYGHPPKAHRFRKGQSGNPSGRPKGIRSLTRVLEEVLAQDTTVRVRGRAKKMSKLDAMMRTLADGAVDTTDPSITTVGNVQTLTFSNLDDLTQIRTSLVQRVTELKTSVEQMTRDSQDLVAHLKAEVSTFQTRLKAVESLVLKDELTGVANRRSIEERIQWHIRSQQTFCVVMLDLNGFKQINDRHGHQAGDDLLRQFSKELQMNARSGDLVGRWGGDEFVVLLACDAAKSTFHLGRIREWVFGKYTITTGANRRTVDVNLDAAIGVGEWRAGLTAEQVVAEADAAMYKDKHRARAVHA